MPEPRTIALAPLGMSPEEIAGRSFAVVRRGLDPDAVRRFLEEVAGVVRQARARELELQSRLVDAEQRAASPVLDEAVLSAALGAETARVLKVAHEAAQEVVQKAEQRAAALLEQASTVHATRGAEAEAEADAVLDEARRAAEDIVERTKAECRSTLEHARQARRRVLDDLARRRRDLHGQIQQLRAAKDTLSGIFGEAAAAVAELQGRLGGAEEEAHEAASDLAQHLHDEAGATMRLDAVSLGLVAAADAPATLTAADHGLDEAAEAADFEGELALLQPVRDPAPAPPADGDGDAFDAAARFDDVPDRDDAGSFGEAGSFDDTGDVGDFDDVDELVEAERYGGPRGVPFDGDAVAEREIELFDGDAVEAAAAAAAATSVAGADADADADADAGRAAGEPSGTAEGLEEVAVPDAAAGAGDADAAGDAGDDAGGDVAASADGGAAEPGKVAAADPEAAAREIRGEVAEPEPAAAEAAGLPATAEGGQDAAAAPEGSAPTRSGSAVDALFARIRASRTEEVAKAREVLGEPGGAGGEPGGAGSPLDGIADEPTVGAQKAPAAAGGAPEAEEDEAEGTEEPGGDEVREGASVAARRDAALQPVRVEVSRALKRVLRSQQNELLDAARTLKLSEADALLAGDQTFVRIAEAVGSALETAWRAGRAEVGDPGAGTVGAGDVGELSTGLAVEVVGAIETRIREGISSLRASGETTEEGLGELVGVAYRDWKGARIDAVADDVALRAFAAGSVAGAAATGAKLRWLLQQDQPCADCDDNALSGPLAPGEAFPTGQPHPPLHAGCRCVLVAVPG